MKIIRKLKIKRTDAAIKIKDADMPRVRQELKQITADLQNVVRKIAPLQIRLKAIAQGAKGSGDDYVVKYALALKGDIGDAIELLENAGMDISLM